MSPGLSQAGGGGASGEFPSDLGRLQFLVDRVLETEPWDRSPHIGELERAVRSVASAMRERGATPERMVIALKQATARSSRLTTRTYDLHQRMIFWSVVEYFRREPGGSVE